MAVIHHTMVPFVVQRQSKHTLLIGSLGLGSGQSTPDGSHWRVQCCLVFKQWTRRGVWLSHFKTGYTRIWGTCTKSLCMLNRNVPTHHEHIANSLCCSVVCTTFGVCGATAGCTEVWVAKGEVHGASVGPFISGITFEANLVVSQSGRSTDFKALAPSACKTVSTYECRHPTSICLTTLPKSRSVHTHQRLH